MKPLKLIIWGTGSGTQKVLDQLAASDEYDIIGFGDNDAEKWGRVWNSKPVISPKELNELAYDYIIILSGQFWNIIWENLVYFYHVDKDKIRRLRA